MGDLCEPGSVLDQLQDFHSSKKFDAVGRRIPQRLEQPSRHQNRHVMRLAVQDPRGLFRGQAGRWKPQGPARWSSPAWPSWFPFSGAPCRRPPGRRAGGARPRCGRITPCSRSLRSGLFSPKTRLSSCDEIGIRLLSSSNYTDSSSTNIV